MHEDFSVPRSEQVREKCPLHYASIANVKSQNLLNLKSIQCTQVPYTSVCALKTFTISIYELIFQPVIIDGRAVVVVKTLQRKLVQNIGLCILIVVEISFLCQEDKYYRIREQLFVLRFVETQIYLNDEGSR